MIIGISGKQNSGRYTIGLIICYLISITKDKPAYGEWTINGFVNTSGWQINKLFSFTNEDFVSVLHNTYKDMRWISKAAWDMEKDLPYNADNDQPIYPNWIIPNVQFPNEADAIKEKGGILIKVNRHKVLHDFGDKLFGKNTTSKFVEIDFSETPLDDYPFDYNILNNGTIDELITEVKEILIKERIIWQMVFIILNTLQIL